MTMTTTTSYDSSSRDPDARRRLGRGRLKLVLSILVAVVTLFELLAIAKDKSSDHTIELKHDEEDRNQLRREIASKLFPDTTFHPPARLDSRPPPPRDGPTLNSLLFPVRIGEQESKAQQHLHQLALLAIALNRTLVLPNVARSRLHACHPFPFAFHYDVATWRDRYDGKLSVVPQEDWLRHLDEQGDATTTYTARAVKLVEGKRSSTRRDDEDDEQRLDLSQFCLARFSRSFETSSSSPVVMSTYYAPFHYREYDDLALAAFSNGLASALSRSPTPSSIPTILDNSSTIPRADVLFVDYDLRYPMFPSFVPNSTDLVPRPVNTTTALKNADSTLVPLDDEEDLPSLEQVVATYDPFPALDPLKSSSSSFLEFSPLPYSTLWIKLADVIADRTRPFVGVHWRMETVPTSHLAQCAHALAEEIRSLSFFNHDDDETSREDRTRPRLLESIYLASDFSFDPLLSSSPSVRGSSASSSSSSLSLSDTFTDVTWSHRAAASRLVRLLQSLPSSPPPRSSTSWWPLKIWSTLFSSSSSSSLEFSRPPPNGTKPPSLELEISTLSTRLEQTFLDPTLPLQSLVVEALEPFRGFDLFRLDPGLRSILDKLVLERADEFVAAWPAAEREEDGDGASMCGKSSSFTDAVVSERRRRRRKEAMTRVSSEKNDNRNDSIRQGEEGVDDNDIEMDKDVVRWFRRPV